MNPNPSHKKIIIALVILVVLTIIAILISSQNKQRMSQAEAEKQALERLSSPGESPSLTPEQQKALDSLDSKERPKTSTEQKQEDDALRLLQGK